MEINKNKALKFVNHIKKHLDKMYGKGHNAKVICKICGKTINQIAEE